MIIDSRILQVDVVSFLLEATFYSHNDACLIVGLVIIVGIARASSIRLDHEEAVVILESRLHVGSPTLVSVQWSEAVVSIVYILRNAVIICLNDEHCSVGSLVAYYDSLLAH